MHPDMRESFVTYDEVKLVPSFGQETLGSLSSRVHYIYESLLSCDVVDELNFH